MWPREEQLVVAVGARMCGGVPYVECPPWWLTEAMRADHQVVVLPEPEALAARLAARAGAPC